MNVWEALRQGRRLLSQVSEEAELDAELLLRHCLSLDRTSLYRRLTEDMSSEQEVCYRGLIVRRLTHEPTAYILGHKAFFGLDFEVAPTALIPRPETELLVELAIQFLEHDAARTGPLAVDVGTGCGLIAISVAHALPETRILATDVSAEALGLARRNAERHRVQKRVQFVRGDLLEPVEHAVRLIATNLPYVRTRDWMRLPPEIRDHEPRAALDGGPDGLQIISRLLEQAPRYLERGGLLLAEIGDRQGRAVTRLAREDFRGASVEIRKDFAGHDRVLVVHTA